MKNVPKLRFKDDNGRDFPAWEDHKLSGLVEIYDGTHQTPDYKDQGIPFYSVENITRNDFSNTKFISKEVFVQENKRIKLEKGDILMTKIGDIGTPKYIDWDVEASFYVSLALIKQSKKINSLFLSHYMKSTYFQRELHQRIIHVAFPKKINLGEIGNCLAKSPCSREQTKIADFLTAIDDRISQLSQKCDGLAQYKKGVMQKIFSQELRFKDEKGRAFPAWEEKRLGDVGVFQGGGTPTTADDRYWNGVVPWISSSDLNENSIHEISITRFISDLAIKESATKLIQKNSLLIVSRVGVGKLAVTLDKVCTSQDFTNFTPQSDNVFYLAYYLFFHKGKLLSFSQGTSIKGFTKDDISSLKVELPCLKEQEKIAGFLSAVDEKISQAQAKLDALKQYKQGLLQQMFV